MAVILAVLLITLCIGLWCLPNNNDVMTYHLPRIMHWIQNGQIGSYFSGTNRQIYQHPGAEYLQLQVYLLTGSDSAMHLVQWMALVGCILASGLIVRALHGPAAAAWLAMMLVATTPMAIFQSTSCKNDLLLSAFALTAIWLTLSLRSIRRSWLLELALMLACGGVLFIKITGYVYLPPLVLGVGCMAWHRRGLFRAITLTAGTGLVTVCLIAWQWVSCWMVFGSIFGVNAQQLRPHGNLPAAIVINLLRNLGSELSTPVQTINNLMVQSFTVSLSLVGLNIHDTRSLSYSDTYFLNANHVLSEDHAGAPLLMTLILIAMVRIIWRGTNYTRAYLAIWILACVMFSVIVSWDQWMTRLLLPLMLTATPLVAVSLNFHHWPAMGKRSLLWLCLVMATPALLFNHSRSLLGPYSIFTHNRTQVQLISFPIEQRDINQIIPQLEQRNARDLALDLGGGLQYLFWQRLGGPAHVHLIQVQSRLEPSTEPHSEPNHDPLWLITFTDKSSPPHTTSTRYVGQVRYDRVWQGDQYALFKRSASEQQ